MALTITNFPSTVKFSLANGGVYHIDKDNMNVKKSFGNVVVYSGSEQSKPSQKLKFKYSEVISPVFVSNDELVTTLISYKVNTGITVGNVIITDGSSIAGIDAVTGALETIDYEHHEIHSGSHYFLDDYIPNIPINNVYDIQIRVPDDIRRAHMTFEVSSAKETTWQLLEGVTVILAGDVLTPINNERASVNTSMLTVNGIANSSVANANSDTATAAAIILAQGALGAGQNGGSANRQREIILKGNTSYTLRFIATTAGYVDYSLRWYEHTSKG